MTSLLLSAAAFFAASYFTRRWLDDMGIAKTRTRGMVIFTAAALLSYGVGFVVDRMLA
jgi:hypothetical protein